MTWPLGAHSGPTSSQHLVSPSIPTHNHDCDALRRTGRAPAMATSSGSSSTCSTNADGSARSCYDCLNAVDAQVRRCAHISLYISQLNAYDSLSLAVCLSRAAARSTQAVSASRNQRRRRSERPRATSSRLRRPCTASTARRATRRATRVSSPRASRRSALALARASACAHVSHRWAHHPPQVAQRARCTT